MGRIFPCVEPAVGDVITIKYDHHVKLHSQYLLKKIISEVPHLRITTYNVVINNSICFKINVTCNYKISIPLKLQLKK